MAKKITFQTTKFLATPLQVFVWKGFLAASSVTPCPDEEGIKTGLKVHLPYTLGLIK